MRLAELIGCRLFDCDGTEVGGVHDVRFTADGPPYAATGKPSYRLSALIVGDKAVGDRLGYVRHEMKGPWPLPWLFSRLSRRSRVVDWDHVTRVERPRIEIRCRASDLPALAEEDQGGRP
jgi:PRC-barrel domain protein